MGCDKNELSNLDAVALLVLSWVALMLDLIASCLRCEVTTLRRSGSSSRTGL